MVYYFSFRLLQNLESRLRNQLSFKLFVTLSLTPENLVPFISICRPLIQQNSPRYRPQTTHFIVYTKKSKLFKSFNIDDLFVSETVKDVYCVLVQAISLLLVSGSKQNSYDRVRSRSWVFQLGHCSRFLTHRNHNLFLLLIRYVWSVVVLIVKILAIYLL